MTLVLPVEERQRLKEKSPGRVFLFDKMSLEAI